VIGLTWRSQVAWAARGDTTQVKGEAVFVDLGGGRHVIATLGFGPYGIEDTVDRLAFEAFKRAGRPMDAKTIAKARGHASLNGDLLPILVTFADPKNPKTARVLKVGDFHLVFGQGVRFRDARIELTADPVTRGITQKLPWLVDFKGYSGGQLHPDWSKPEKNLTTSMFIKGML
jgi:hypothetical protein